MENLKALKKLYDKLGNDYLRSTVLTAADMFGIRKDLVRMDTNCCCNLRCIMCNAKPPVHSAPYMKFEEFQKIMDRLGPTTRMLYLSCAYEPLMTPHFSKYLKYAKEKNIPHISFCTNALLLNEKLIHTLIWSQIDEIIISFNGFCKRDYNRIMKGSDFDKVCTNLKMLVDMKKKYLSDKPKIRMNTVLLKSNLLHFNEMFQLVLNCGIDFIQFREPVLYKNQNNPWEVRRELLQNQSQEEHQKLLDMIQNMTNRFQACGKKIILPSSILHQTMPAASMEVAEEIHPIQSKEKWSIKKEKNIQKQRCCVPFFSYWIDHKGSVKVCGYDKKGDIGNILTDSPKLLSKNKKLFQKQALSGNCTHHRCSINVDTSSII